MSVFNCDKIHEISKWTSVKKIISGRTLTWYHSLTGLLKKKQSKTYCVVPWTQLAINSSGQYRVCCNALPEKNLVRNKVGKTLLIYKNSVSEAWESETYQKIRRQMLNSERPDMCMRCFREEDSGVESARQKLSKRWSSSHAYDPDPPMDIKYVDLRLGNLCNLKCRMCNPYSSNKWVDEWNKVTGKAELDPNFALSKNQIKKLKNMDWPDFEKTWRNLYPILESIEELYLTGGEPFVSLKQVDLLKKMVNSGKSKNITLKYNTNLTLLPERLIPLWKNFKAITINASIDGIGAVNDYIRHPSQWETVHGNLKKLFELKKQGLPLGIYIHITVQMYNILRLHESIRFFKDNFGLESYLNILNHPYCLNIRTLPDLLKEKVIFNLSPLSFIISVDEVIKYLNQESLYNKYYKEFLDYTKTLDRLREESFEKIAPEFFQNL